MKVKPGDKLIRIDNHTEFMTVGHTYTVGVEGISGDSVHICDHDRMNVEEEHMFFDIDLFKEAPYRHKLNIEIVYSS